ncbi:MAG: GerMN domain-containing protein [Acidimicrobiales bacterium]
MTRRVLAALFVTLSVMAAACSVPRDDNARIVTNPQRNTIAPVTTSSVDAPRTQAKVYFVRTSDKKLEGIMTGVKMPVDASALLEALIVDGPQESRLESKIPKTVTFQVVDSPTKNEKIVILPNFDVRNVNRNTLILAFQQIVFTLTGLPDVDSVQFSVRNGLYPVPLKSGDKPTGQGVRPSDYDAETVYTTTTSTSTIPPTTPPAPTTPVPSSAPGSLAPGSLAPGASAPGASAPTSGATATSR